MTTDTGTGYAHRDYAFSLRQFGTPRELMQSKGWVLERAIAGTTLKDAMGSYPLFACLNWSQLQADLKDIHDLVSLALVTDPFGEYDAAYLRQCFDMATPYKEHYVIDLEQPIKEYVSPHHARYAKKAMGSVTVAKSDAPQALLDDWSRLYDTLIQRHGIKGISAFSKESFAQQLSTPGIGAFSATCDGEVVGMLLWYTQGQVAYYHLGAYSERGYELRASFALFWFVIEYFAGIGLRWLDLGAGAGVHSDGNDGLSQFKRGWSNAVRQTYFCGRVFNPEAYASVVKERAIPQTSYFPAYRAGEFR
jgi:hypothetical protein